MRAATWSRATWAAIARGGQRRIPVGDFGIDGIPGDPEHWDVAIDWMLEWVAIFYQYDYEAGFLDVLRIQVNDHLPDESETSEPPPLIDSN